MESRECGEKQKKYIRGKRKFRKQTHTHTHTHIHSDPMLKNTVIELWSTVVMRLHLKPMKPLWQLMKARLVSPPHLPLGGVCLCGYVWVSVRYGGGRMHSIWPDLRCSFPALLAAALSQTSRSPELRFLCKHWWGFPKTHLTSYYFTQLLGRNNNQYVFIQFIIGINDDEHKDGTSTSGNAAEQWIRNWVLVQVCLWK